MLTKRHLGGGLLAILVVSSGCVGFLAGSEELSFAADPAATADSAASSAGYESNGTRTQRVEREFTVAGQTRTVEAANEITTYEKAIEIPLLGEAKLGVFTLVSSPAVEIAGETFNPIGDYSNDRLVRLVASEYGGLSGAEQVSERRLTALGTRTTVTKYSATATVQGEEVDVFVHVTKVRDGEDFVVALGIYPQRLDGEAENVLDMIRAVEHPT
jgi:hypothetical protein